MEAGPTTADNPTIHHKLQSSGIEMGPGMTARELDSAESFFQFRFPKEIREFLAGGVPLGDSFFNYRDLTQENLEKFLKFQDSIENSFRFDLENNREDLAEMLADKLDAAPDTQDFDEAVLQYLKQSVRLIPFYAHRCFFDGMNGMPIVSFWQAADTIFYGDTFENYLEVEFLKGDRILENPEDRMKDTGIWFDIIW